MKRALITGITGQDGSYLAELLLARGDEVHGLVRRSSTFNTSRIDHLYRDPHEPGTRLFLHFGDLDDGSSLERVVAACRPDEVYHLAAQSHVRVSFDMPEYTGAVTGLGTLRLLEALRRVVGTGTRFFHASSSEMFGGGGGGVATQNEDTPFHPRSPYAAAKAYAHHVTRLYREAYGLFAVNGILFNHESERRGETFVTRKITRAAARIKLGLQRELYLGNLDARRDWGHAEDVVHAMVLMLGSDRPADYVIGTGESHSVRELLELAFGRCGLRWQDHVHKDPRYLRPAEVDELCADASRARAELGWRPRVTFEDLVSRMVEYDLALAARERGAPSPAQ